MSLRNLLKQSHSFVVLGAVIGAAILAGCQRNAPSDGLDGHNLVTNSDPNANRTIGEGDKKFAVMSQQSMQQQTASHKLKLVREPAAQAFLSKVASEVPTSSLNGTGPTITSERDQSLVVGIPTSLLGERYVFGAVITKISSADDANLGDLKLTDLPPTQVRAVIAKTSDTHFALALLGCLDKCTEASEDEPIVSFPVSAVDDTNDMVMIDFASVGDGLNFIAMLDPDGSTTSLTTKTSKTLSVDYSLSTLVFDIASDMVPKDQKAAKAGVKETTFTTRWYLRLNSAFNSAFEPRPATDGVGFFVTDRSASPVIERQALPTTFSADQPAQLHYYIKNVPKEYQAAFAGSFDEWNKHFTDLIGKNMFSYEFVDSTDPRAALLIPGDVRYHILEWDLENQATYGGFGPSIANQFSGEIFTSNVLVQGPTIVQIYSKWFDVGQKVATLRAQGDEAGAHELIQAAQKELDSKFKPAHNFKFTLTLNNRLKFRIGAQTPSLEDPAISRQDFDSVPPNVTYDQYMAGYFHDMVTHELGHNLGLRHNFRGSLYAVDGQAQAGKVTISIMEYLNRDFRYLDHVGSYDLMALNYGYLGIEPTVTTEYCTDEDAPTPDNVKASAECSSEDETDDPFTYFSGRLSHAVDLLIARDQSAAPGWTVDEMKDTLEPIVTGLGLYAATADTTSKEWTNFFGKLDRPSEDSADVKAYVVSKIKAQLCDPSVAKTLALKTTADAKAQVTENLSDLQAEIVAILAPYKVLKASDLACASR
jgi:hypothetical protein